MARNRNYSTRSSFLKNISSKDKETLKGVVVDVILDDEHPLVKDGEVPLGRIGHIKFLPMGGGALLSKKDAYFAAPASKNFTSVPLKNERVDIISTPNGYYYRRNSVNISPNIDSVDNVIDNLFNKLEGSSEGNSKDYNSTANTGISNKSDEGSSEDAGYGEIFKPEAENIHSLRLNDGDTLIQSRFGQSIRFTAYDNSEKTSSPTILIRNRENDLSQNDIDTGFSTTEDINRDGSSIVLSSKDYKLDFQPGVIDDGGSTNFETKPTSFQDYPSELKGDQILINSGRVIISAKESEMIFYSKGNYGFISDSTLSIDNKEGMLVSVGDDIFFTTNDSDFRITSGTGEIHLGNGAGEEKLAKGETLVDLLSELIDAINQMTHPTPSGPSGPPVNAATFTNIKTRLKTILSSQNFTT